MTAGYSRGALGLAVVGIALIFCLPVGSGPYHALGSASAVPHSAPQVQVGARMASGSVVRLVGFDAPPLSLGFASSVAVGPSPWTSPMRAATPLGGERTSGSAVLGHWRSAPPLNSTASNDTWVNRSNTIVDPIVSFVVAGSNLVYDGADGYLVRFGGGIPAYLTPDTWAYANGIWTNLSTGANSPPGRIFGSMVYDYADRAVLLFGGAILSGSNLSELGDTWSFSAGRWTQLHPTTSPPAREGAAMAYDPFDGYVVLFGGGNATTSFSDTWTFTNGNWTELHPTTSPPSRALCSMSWDSFSPRIVVFGGDSFSTSGGVATTKTLNDTWAFSAGNWAPVVTTSAPSARYDYSMANDTGDGTIILTGGTNGSVAYNDTWSFFAGAWTQVTSAHAPLNRYPTQATYDDSLNRVVLVAPLITSTALGGALWGYAAGSWRLLGIVGYPGPIITEGLAENVSSGTALLFGGSNTTALLQSTWQFHHDVWQQLEPPTSPSARGGPALTYDPDLNGFLLFGGGNSTAVLGDTWVFRGGNWQPLTPAGPIPAARDFASLTYDPALHAAILFGGYVSASTPAGDTWAFESVNGSFRWVNWTTASGAGPSARGGAGATYDARMSDLVLFGGTNSTGTTLRAGMNDTWVVTPAGNWSRLGYTHAPAARDAMGFSYDPAIGEDILVAGGNATGQLSDTWMLGPAGWTQAASTVRPPALQFVPLIFDASTGTMYSYGGLQTTTTSAAYLYGTSWFFDPLRTEVVANQSGGAVPTNISFASATSGGVAPLRYTWSLGNGTAATAQNASRQYLQPGTYAIRLNVTDAFGVTARVTLTETLTGVGIPPLGAHASASHLSGRAPLVVDLTGSASGGEGPYHFAWTLGDGTTSSSENVTHTYALGNYNVVLNVTDRLGTASTASLTITVNPAPVTVSVGTSATSGVAPLTVYFSVTEGGGVPPYALSWSFGDGTRGTGLVASHTFTAAGNYTVQVVITDHRGATNSTSFPVTVTGGAGPSGVGGGSTLPWWLLPAILAVVVIAGAVAFRYWRGRRGPTR